MLRIRRFGMASARAPVSICVVEIFPSQFIGKSKRIALEIESARRSAWAWFRGCAPAKKRKKQESTQSVVDKSATLTLPMQWEEGWGEGFNGEFSSDPGRRAPVATTARSRVTGRAPPLPNPFLQSRRGRDAARIVVIRGTVPNLTILQVPLSSFGGEGWGEEALWEGVVVLRCTPARRVCPLTFEPRHLGCYTSIICALEFGH